MVTCGLIMFVRLAIIAFCCSYLTWAQLLYESLPEIEVYDSVVVALSEQLQTHAQTAEETKKETRIVLQRRPAQGHCPRPHEYKEGALRLDISKLNSVLRVDSLHAGLSDWELVPVEIRDFKEIAAVATVGALSSMEVLVDTLLPLGLVPAVVPEFKGITVGGAVQGLAAESSSAKYGFVHDSVIEFDALLANGTRVTCSRTRNAELFRAVPGSFGSLATVSYTHLTLPTILRV